MIKDQLVTFKQITRDWGWTEKYVQVVDNNLCLEV